MDTHHLKWFYTTIYKPHKLSNIYLIYELRQEKSLLQKYILIGF